MLAFIVSLDDFIITNFVKGAGIETLPTAIFGSVKQGLKPNIMAISTMLLGLSDRDGDDLLLRLEVGQYKIAKGVNKMKLLTHPPWRLRCLANSAAEGELVLYHWFEYIPAELLEKFTAETGITVTMDTYDSNEAMLAS